MSESELESTNHRAIFSHLTWVGAVTLMGIWIPIRALYFDATHFADFVVELACVALYAPTFMRRWKSYSKTHGDDGEDKLTHAESHVSTAIDLAIAMPWMTLLGVLGAEPSSAFLLVKLLALPQMFRVRAALDLVGNLHPVLSRLVPLAFVVPMIVHLVACGWVWLGSGTAGPSDDKVFEYGRALYWAITTLATVGYGDISAKTLPQMFFASITMVVGVGFFGFVLSNVASLLSRLDAARESYLSVLDNVESFMRTNRVPTNTRTKVRSYFNYLWESRGGLDHGNVLELLPTNLRSEISLFLNAGILKKVPLLKDAGQDVWSDIVLELAPRVAVPGEKIFHVGEAGDAMYFVHQGHVEIKSIEGKTLVTLTEGSFFGEMALVTNNPRNATALATTYTDLFVLSREGFEKVKNRYPSFAEQIQKHVDAIKAQQAMKKVS
jgi:hypothetical protein